MQSTEHADHQTAMAPSAAGAAHAGEEHRPRSPHFGRFTRSNNGTYTLSRILANDRAAAAKKSSTNKAQGMRGPSPQRAESSATGARHPPVPVLQEDGFYAFNSVKKEPQSSFLIRTTLPHGGASDDDEDDEAELSPSEAKALRETKKARENFARKLDKGKNRAPAPAFNFDFDFEMDGLEEVPAPSKTPLEHVDAMPVDSASDDDSGSDPGDSDDENGGVAIDIPTPDEDELEATRAIHPALSQSSIRVTVAGAPHIADGLPRDYFWHNVCPQQRDAILSRRGRKKLARALGVIGRPDINPRDPAMLARLNKVLPLMLGKHTKALATRLNAPVGAGPEENVEPDIFAITGLTNAEADLFEQVKWMLASILQLELHDIDEEASDFLYVASGARVSKRHFEQLLFEKWNKDEGIIAVAERVAASKITLDEAKAMIVGSATVRFHDVVIPESPGVKTRQFIVNAGAFMTGDTHRKLKEAASAIVVDTFIRGRAEAWSAWKCIVCHSVSHPTGLCPSRVLEGWAEAADIIVRRNKERRRRAGLAAGNTQQNANASRGGHGGNNNAGRGGGSAGRGGNSASNGGNSTGRGGQRGGGRGGRGGNNSARGRQSAF